MSKADYSKIASYYDQGRSISNQNLDLWLGLIAKYSKASTSANILDFGRGTGRFSIPLANRLHLQVTGADSSKEMLAEAKKKDANGLVTWDQQHAEDLTYPDNSFEVVFMSHLLHHVDSPLRVLRKCKRILNPKGSIIIRFGAIDQIREDVEHTFFPETIPIDESRTPTINMVEQWLSNAGFSDIVSEEAIQKTYDSGLSHLNATKAKNTSVLSMISPEAFENGIKRLSKYIEENPNDPWLLFDKMTLTVGYGAPRVSPGPVKLPVFAFGFRLRQDFDGTRRRGYPPQLRGDITP